jgi:hypothetical protein
VARAYYRFTTAPALPSRSAGPILGVLWGTLISEPVAITASTLTIVIVPIITHCQEQTHALIADLPLESEPAVVL